MDTLQQDLRYAFRTLWKNPGFTVIILLTIGLGIGVNTAIFSLLDQVLLRQLPVQHADELVQFDNPGAFMGRTMNRSTFSYPMYRDFRERNDVFTGVLARVATPVTATIDNVAERVNAELVSGNYFQVLGVRPLIGRLFTPDDERVANGHPHVVLSHGYWARRFASDPTVLNRTIRLNGHPMTIVGVAPRGFFGVEVGFAPDMIVPVMQKLQMTPTWDDLENRRSRWLSLLARLKPGVTLQQAEASMNVLYRQINEQELKEIESPSASFARRFVEKRLTVLPGATGRSDLRRSFGTALTVLMGMVGLVLLIACANVANLLLARATLQQKEVAIRLALGASRVAIIRQRFSESLMLAIGGGVLGILLSWWTTQLLINLLPDPAIGASLTADPDRRVLLFALVASVATAILAGVVPAVQTTRPALTAALKEEAGSLAGGPRQVRLRKGLVIAQVALSALLLVGAGLFARSLYNLRTLDPGFRTDDLLTFSIDPALSGYRPERVLAVLQQMQADLSGIAGVRSVSQSQVGVLTGNQWSRTVNVDGYDAKEGEDLNPTMNGVGPAYFSTLGVPLVSGREFSERDGSTAPKVAIVNEAFQRYFFGGRSAIGHRFGFGRRSNEAEIEIVGVVKDTKFSGMRDDPDRFVYLPYGQAPEVNSMTFYLRLAPDARGIADQVRAVVRRTDAGLPVYDVKTMEVQMDESLFTERVVAMLSASFGMLATVLAAVGLYGLMSYTVARRTREIGIRLALGAERNTVLWMVLREVAVLAGIGLALGLPTAMAAGRLVRAQLFGLSPLDPLTLTVAGVALGTVALVSGLVPARRATKVDPMSTLRYE